MWLLGTKTLELHNFITDVPDYVILSHTWGVEEVSFDDIKDPQVRQRLTGFDKIVGCCQQARQDGFEWAWIDTCCIDKRSSAELSEAINSMYNWYWQAAKCYAYLSDVPDLRSFTDSTWFERGWTLQELLAPAVLEFFDCEWIFLGTKLSLVDDIVQATGIDRKYITRRHVIQEASVATKLSWASKRSTTRIEDIAYCLLGLMRVNMPMLYGEGNRAFFRLQLELLKNSNEHTIFAWEAPGDRYTALPDGEVSTVQGVLAPSPAWFRNSAGMIATGVGSVPHEVTNNGLRIKLRTTRDKDMPLDEDITVAWLRCRDEHGNIIGVPLSRRPSAVQYCRTGARLVVEGWKNYFYFHPLTDMYLQVMDHDRVRDHSRYSRPAALRVSQIHTYRGCHVQLVSISSDQEIITNNDLIDSSVTSIVDSSYIVNELIVSGDRVACLSMRSAEVEERETLVFLGLCGLEPIMFAIDRLGPKSPDVNWHTILAQSSKNRQDFICDSLTTDHIDFKHTIRAKVIKEGTRLVWSVTITAAELIDRSDFYGYFGSLKGRHQENNLACFCIDCRVQRLHFSNKNFSNEKTSRWKASVEIRREMLASAQRQQQKQRNDTGMGHVLECTCSACAKESFIEVSPEIGLSDPHVHVQPSKRAAPLEAMKLVQHGERQASHEENAVETRSTLGPEHPQPSSSVEPMDTQEPEP